MTRAWCVMAAVGGLAASVAGQSVTLNFSIDTSDYSIGEPQTWTVSASFSGYDDPSAYFGGFVGSFVASDSGLGQTSNFQNLLVGEGTPASSDGGNVLSVNIFNAALLGSNDPANPIDLFRFDFTPQAFGVISYDAVGLVTVFPDDGIFTLGDEYTDFEVFSDRVVFPAPGTGAGIAGGVLILSGRRRGRRMCSIR